MKGQARDSKLANKDKNIKKSDKEKKRAENFIFQLIQKLYIK